MFKPPYVVLRKVAKGMTNKWTDNDTKKETGDSAKKVAEAGHDARDAAAQAGQLGERNANKVKDSESGPALHQTFKDAGMVKDAQKEGEKSSKSETDKGSTKGADKESAKDTKKGEGKDSGKDSADDK
jgi:hypothetical protein